MADSGGWLFNGVPFDEQAHNIAELVGFVYKITNTATGQFYIGKKVFHFAHKKKLTKKELAEFEGRKGRKPTHKHVAKDSDWRTYYSSCDQLKADIAVLGKETFKREILVLCRTKKQLTYWEVHMQCLHGCLLGVQCYNDNINGTYFTGDMLADVLVAQEVKSPFVL